MKRKLKLSIIIVNFNTYKFSKKCLDSIYQGDLAKDSFEIIVVDNASNDNSSDLISKHCPSVKLVRNKRNVGFAAANNQAIKKTKGDFILFLNPDTVVNHNTLGKMVEFMERNPRVGVATCKVVLSSRKLDDACHRGFPTPWNALCQFSGMAKIFPKSQLFNGYHLGYKDMDKIHEIDSCSGAFMLVRKSIGESVGWLDEDYFWYGEDLDFCFRMKRAGWKIMYVPHVEITHYRGVSSGIKKHSKDISSADIKTQILATRARFEVMRIFYKKHYQDKYPSWLTWLVLGGIKIKEKLTMLRYKLNPKF